MYPGDGQHVGDGGDSSPLRTDQPALRPVQQELGGWKLAGAQLVLQLGHVHAVWQAVLNQCEVEAKV